MFVSSRRIDWYATWLRSHNMTYLGHTVTLSWRDLRSNFKIDLPRIKNIWIDAAWRDEHDGVKIIPLDLILEKLFMNKHFPPIRTFSVWWPLVLTVLGWPPIWQIDSGDPELSFGYLTTLLASIVVEIIAIFCENSPILRKFDIFWPPWPQIWPDQKIIQVFFVELVTAYPTLFTACRYLS